MAPLRVVFADDNYLVREGVTALLAEVDAVDLVRSVADPPALLTAVAELAPDAVLTDIRMPPSFTNEGIVAAKQIRAAHPGTGVVVRRSTSRRSTHSTSVVGGEQHDDGAVGRPGEPSARLDPVDAGQVHVQEHELRAQARREVQ